MTLFSHAMMDKRGHMHATACVHEWRRNQYIIDTINRLDPRRPDIPFSLISFQSNSSALSVHSFLAKTGFNLLRFHPEMNSAGLESSETKL